MVQRTSVLLSMDELRVRISSDSAKLLFSFLAPTPRWQFDGEVWTLTASETVPTLSEQGTVRILGERFVDEHGRMRAGWWRVSSVGVLSSKDRRSGPTRLPSASRITVAPGHCVRSRQSGQQSALRSSEFGFLPVSVDRLYSRLLSASGCVHRKKGRLREFSRRRRRSEFSNSACNIGTGQTPQAQCLSCIDSE